MDKAYQVKAIFMKGADSVSVPVGTLSVKEPFEKEWEIIEGNIQKYSKEHPGYTCARFERIRYYFH